MKALLGHFAWLVGWQLNIGSSQKNRRSIHQLHEKFVLAWCLSQLSLDPGNRPFLLKFIDLLYILNYQLLLKSWTNMYLKTCQLGNMPNNMLYGVISSITSICNQFYLDMMIVFYVNHFQYIFAWYVHSPYHKYRPA